MTISLKLGCPANQSTILVAVSVLSCCISDTAQGRQASPERGTAELHHCTILTQPPLHKLYLDTVVATTMLAS